MDRGDIEVALQPLVDIRSGYPVRLEALCRWTHPTFGPIPPSRFIPLAETTELITPLTFMMLRQTLADLREWRRKRPDLRMNINLSIPTLLERDLTERLAQTLEDASCDGSVLGVEVTESTLLAEPSRVAEALEGMRALGMRVEIDDFGTGYSSLGRLMDLPIDAVKIDRRFVGPMVHDRRSEAIVRATIALAHDLALETVAEGVEDGATWDLLRAHGCDTAQGYHIARPMPVSEVPRWLDSWETGLGFPERSGIGQETRPAARTPARDVLVVDDEPAILALVRAALEEEGFHVVTVANGAEALRELDRTPPAVVLLDMQMPIVDGPPFIRAMRARGMNVPIVIMTAGSSAARSAKELDADAYLSKPFEISQLVDITSRYAVAHHET